MLEIIGERESLGNCGLCRKVRQME